MRDLAIAARIGSPHTSFSVLKRFINSLFINIGDCDWCLFLSLGNINEDIILYLKNLASIHPNKIIIFQKGNYYWADFINEAINISSNFEWFIKSHDDIELLTPNFFNKIDRNIKLSNNIGWISFTDAGYKDGYWSPPTRPGYHLDFYDDNCWNKKIMFQYHSLKPGWQNANALKKIKRYFKGDNSDILERSLFDFPSEAVRCHAPWNMFVMIKMSVLKDIGKCESWNTYNALFVDEDWGLAATIKGYVNIYISNLEYYHYRPNFLIGGNRSQSQAKIDDIRVKELFKTKWGFYPNPGIEGLDKVPKALLWSSKRKSYDWDFNIL